MIPTTRIHQLARRRAMPTQINRMGYLSNALFGR